MCNAAIFLDTLQCIVAVTANSFLALHTHLVPSQWLLVTRTAPLDGRASGLGVEPQRFSFQANLCVDDRSQGQFWMNLSKGESSILGSPECTT
jgi:hypothetical protein